MTVPTPILVIWRFAEGKPNALNWPRELVQAQVEIIVTQEASASTRPKSRRAVSIVGVVPTPVERGNVPGSAGGTTGIANQMNESAIKCGNCSTTLSEPSALRHHQRERSGGQPDRRVRQTAALSLQCWYPDVRSPQIWTTPLLWLQSGANGLPERHPIFTPVLS
jgi:hypothetical protein